MGELLARCYIPLVYSLGQRRVLKSMPTNQYVSYQKNLILTSTAHSKAKEGPGAILGSKGAQFIIHALELPSNFHPCTWTLLLFLASVLPFEVGVLMLCTSTYWCTI